MVYEIYVTSNADLFREGLNAVATFCRSNDFGVATWIGTTIGILMTAMAYVKQHDVVVYLKWLTTYFLVFNVLLGVPSTVAIINTTDQTVPGLTVDNVPFGIALPAHLITSIGYGFASDLETVFSLSNEEQYHKTGMLFGSNLFRLSLTAQIDDPETMDIMNNYIKSCVVGDILINDKYSFNDLLKAEDVWELMSKDPSSIRGMYIRGDFYTCKSATNVLTKVINKYAEDSSPAILSRYIPSEKPYAAAALGKMVASSYQYFQGASDTSTKILRQNIAINAFRSGIRNYAAETGSVAGIQNIANTMAMNNTRMAWATSQHIGIETLPLMQVVLLLLLLCMFPLIALLTLIPGFGWSVFSNYIYSLMWLETWPIMYTILNLMMNFYVSAGDHGAVTLSNINLLAQEHSDIASIAGYLVLAIPFLSLGIVKGMAFTFNNAAQYLGGMAHSIAQSSATSAATGNYSFGNVSTENATANTLNANKHDTNFTNMQGLSTQQLGNAATVTSTATGSDVYSVGQGMSQLAGNLHAAENTISSMTHSIEKSIGNAYTHHTQYMESKGHNDGLGTSSTSGVSSQVDQAMSTVNRLTHDLSQKEDINETDAFQKLSQISASTGGSASVSGGFKFLGTGVTTSGNVSSSVEGQSTSTHVGNYVSNVDRNVSAGDAKEFRDALNTVKSYSQSHSSSDQNTDSENIAIQMGADLNEAERMSTSIQGIKSNTAGFNSNYNQAFASYVQEKYPEEATQVLSATSNPSMIARQKELSDQFIKVRTDQTVKHFELTPEEVEARFNSVPNSGREKYAVENYKQHSQNLMDKGSDLGVNKEQLEIISTNVRDHINQNDGRIVENKADLESKHSELSSSSNKDIEEGKNYAKKSVTGHAIDGLKDLV